MDRLICRSFDVYRHSWIQLSHICIHLLYLYVLTVLYVQSKSEGDNMSNSERPYRKRREGRIKVMMHIVGALLVDRE